MKIKILTILLLITTLNINAQEFNPEQELSELTGLKENIGITAGFAVNGEIQWTKSSGLSCLDSEIPFSSSTITRIASITKIFTAVAIMQLVENELISLDTPIGNYLKDLSEDKKQITVRQLLSHTSGIPQYSGEHEIENTHHYESLQDAIKVFILRPLLFEPGTKYFYTTYGFVVLGRMIEAVTSMRYEDYMKQNIFDAADMNNTYIEYTNEEYSNKSCLYHNNGRKVRQGIQNDLSNRIPGGGYISTLDDLIKFGNALLDGKFISQECFDKMLEIQPVKYDGNKYGLGWYLYGPPPNENLVIGHGGGQTGCTSQLMIVPKSKTVVVVLSNTSGNYPEIVTYASNLIGFSERNK